MNFDLTNLKINNWSDIEPFFIDLKERKISNINELEIWIKNRSDLSAFIDEDIAWRYIKMTCDTENEQLRTHYEHFVNEIQPKISEFSNILDKQLAENEFFELLSDDYFILKRSLKNNLELFRTENIILESEVDTLSQKFGQISGAMTVNYDNKELTMQQAANYLKVQDRKVRENIYFLINKRRLQDSEKLNKLLSDLIEKRTKIAQNADFNNFRDFKHIQRERFDYSVDNVLEFDETIKNQVMPIVEKITLHRKQKLALNVLKPWDLEVDISGKEPLKVFDNIDEFIEKSILCFKKVRPKYGDFLKTMNEKGFLDLASRKGKAPGGYNYPLMVSNIPFIFMNATSNIRDLETIMHEGGHAIHAFMAKDLNLSEYKHTPSEIAELASMSMELISMEHWDVFFDNKDDLKRAKIHQLEGVISVLPWVATIDKFQQWLYTNPNHNVTERENEWTKIFNEYSSKLIDRSDTDDFTKSLWQKQMHIFEVPFYYIEYAISQLGAIAIWRNYKNNPEKTLDNYENALKLGYSKTLPELYKAAGIKFDFSEQYIKELMSFVTKELEKLYE